MTEKDGAPPPSNPKEPGNRLALAPAATSSSFLGPTPSPRDKMEEYRSMRFEEDERPDLPPVEPQTRKCTDLLFLLIFLLYFLTQCGIAGYGYQNGDPNLLVYGTDNLGNLCGVGDFEDRPFLALPRLTLDVAEAAVTGIFSDVSFFGVCSERCPLETEFVCSDTAEAIIAEEVANGNDNRETIINNCINSLIPAGLNDDCNSAVVQNECFLTVFNTTSFLFRCLPEFVVEVETLENETGCVVLQNVTNADGEIETKCLRFRTVEQITTEEPTDIDIVSQTFNTVGRAAEQIVGDVVQSAGVIGGVGMGLSMLFSVVYVSLLWCFVGPVVWGSLVLIIFVAIVFTLYLYQQAGILTFDAVEDLLGDIANNINDVSGGDINLTINVDLDAVQNSLPAVNEDYQQEYQTAAYVFTAISALLILVILCMIPKISRAVRFFKEASHTLRANLTLLAIPPMTALLSLLNAAFFLSGAAYILTVGEITITQLNFTLFPDQEVEGLSSSAFGSISYANLLTLFLFFGFLWTAQVIAGVSTMIISHVIAQSYWSTKQGTVHYKSGRICAGFHAVFRFHLGTIAFGSLLIAIVQIIRYIAAFIDARTKNLQEENKIIKYLLKSVHCFLYCAEQCVKFASRNAYIMTAMYGSGFCKSSRLAFFAVASNLAQVGAVAFLGDIIVRFGQILVTISCAIVAVVLLDTGISTDAVELTSAIAPIFLVMLLAWQVSSAVLTIYDVAVDTLLLSYCQDRKRLKLRGKEHAKRERRDTVMDMQGAESFKNFMKSHRMDEEKLYKQNSIFTF